MCDAVRVRGPLSHGGWSLTFECGEYMNDQIAELIKIPQGKVLKILVEVL